MYHHGKRPLPGPAPVSVGGVAHGGDVGGDVCSHGEGARGALIKADCTWTEFGAWMGNEDAA